MRFLEPLKFALKAILPPKLFLQILVLKRGYPEPELKLIKYLCDKNKISIDVGAAEGLYSAHLYINSKQCIAFEPRLDAAKDLARLTAGLNPPVQVETVALSDFRGNAELKVFADEVGRSTIEPSNKVENNGDVKIISVTVKLLDDYLNEEEIGFIKIDVEGHEKSVLKGAEKILKKNHPNLLIEIEERHKRNGIQTIKSYLEEFGYKGFYLKDKTLVGIDNFEVKIQQDIKNLDVKGKYINNFIFLTEDNISTVQKFYN